MLADIGCVRAKLLDPDRRARHAGVAPDQGARQYMLSGVCTRTTLATTLSSKALAAASAYTPRPATRAAAFWKVGGFEDVDLQIARNNIDLVRTSMSTGIARSARRSLQERGLSIERRFPAWFVFGMTVFLADPFGLPGISVGTKGRQGTAASISFVELVLNLALREVS